MYNKDKIDTLLSLNRDKRDSALCEQRQIETMFCVNKDKRYSALCEQSQKTLFRENRYKKNSALCYRYKKKDSNLHDTNRVYYFIIITRKILAIKLFVKQISYLK